MQIDQLLDRYPRQLSGGQRQRVALARAMVRRPSVFLMDEPLSNLDAKLRGHMRAELKHMQSTLGTTTIYVTHDQIEAMTLAHRVAILEKGVLQQLDTPAKIYNDPANLFVAQFIGSPPMNVVHGALEGSAFQTRGGKVDVPVAGQHRQGDPRRQARGLLRVAPPGQGNLAAEIYAVELIGDHTLVTVKAGEDMLTVKAPKDFAGSIGENIGISFSKDRLFVFDAATGTRVAVRMTAKLNVGVLGCGPIAQAGHFESCTKASNARLYAICDVADDLRERMACDACAGEILRRL